ncbi:hypothetical protein [Bacillus cereus]|uniref:hypothetical protein n=1 Tax=Bacillus cereus TaxID=1396 RepID=UPI00148250C5|nr:hypothetical protein [Bacillus cereus]
MTVQLESNQNKQDWFNKTDEFSDWTSLPFESVKNEISFKYNCIIFKYAKMHI